MRILMEKNGGFEIAGAYTDPRQALRELPRILPDVVFTDIEMPGLNGMELAREIRSISEGIQIVFVTAYEKYAVGAFAVNAVNYLLKPITAEALEVTARRLLKNLPEKPAPKTCRVLALGSLEVTGSAPVKWPTAKARELFACLLLERGREVDKWRLCETLWPDAPPQRVENRLYSTINRVKSALRAAGAAPAVFCDKGKYRLDPAAFSCDFWELDDFLHTPPAAGEDSAAAYEKVLSLHRGRLFEGEDYFWAVEPARRIEHGYVEGLKRCAEFYMEKFLYVRAENHLRAALRADPADEDAVVLLLRVCFFQKQKKAMSEVYTGFCRCLKKELGILPKPDTQQLFWSLFREL